MVNQSIKRVVKQNNIRRHFGAIISNNALIRIVCVGRFRMKVLISDPQLSSHGKPDQTEQNTIQSHKGGIYTYFDSRNCQSICQFGVR